MDAAIILVPGFWLGAWAWDEVVAWLGGFADLRNLTWVDLPTSHWPIWSRPEELAAIIGYVATAS